MENVKEMNIGTERAGLWIQKLRDAGINWGSGGARDQTEKGVRTRIGESSPEDEQDTIMTDRDTTDSDGNVDMGGSLAATAPKSKQLILNPPTLESSLLMGNVRATRLRSNKPKREDFEERLLPVNQRTVTKPAKAR